ncbi:hypothetical protein [Anaerospora sp.]|jgi:hypothetical protein|uniref:hypothetical protein n=1 Tax=Anaerospora sp. TaxID=1960278 RepID=UPI002898141B|nr:hypothetical protein [Anaerospora sp.]MDF2929405.1 hypothetical protein [Anaerospora sp.]
MNTCYQLLIVDTTAQTLLVVDGLTNAILAEVALPAAEAITAIYPADDGSKVFLPAAGNGGSGSIHILNLTNYSLYRLPVAISHPEYFTLQHTLAYFADPAGTLYTLDTATLAVTPGKTNNTRLSCMSLAATSEHLFSLWEEGASGLLSVMNTAGQLLREYRLPGAPTAMTLDAAGLAYVTLAGENNQLGLAVIGKEPGDLPPTALKLTCPHCKVPLTGYPIHLAVSETTIYLITEEGALTMIDKMTLQPTQHILLGQPLDTIHLLPNGQQAIGLSVMKGNLAMIDLSAGRITALTATSHYLGPIAIVRK